MPRLSDLLSVEKKKSLQSLRSEPISSKPSKKRRAGTHSKPWQLPAFVAVDVETTGLQSKTDRITEIGAAKFVGGTCVATYSRLINPMQPIPRQIVDLTGITNEEAQQQPEFAHFATEIVDFIGDLPLCGHQIEFDVSFLSEEFGRCNMPRISAFRLDTAVLSRLSLPGLSSYSLSGVCMSLGIEIKSAHRALDDAIASGKAAVEMINRLKLIPLETRRILADFTPPSLLKKILQNTLSLPDTAANDSFGNHQSTKYHKRKTNAQIDSPLDVAIIKRDLDGSNPQLSKVFPGFVPRGSQQQLAERVTRAINRKQFLVAEAATGTGKSLAYLLPAARAALLNNSRVIIATHTKHLQDQLAQKELPRIAKILGDEFRFTVLKGRSNYLCRYRYDQMHRGELGGFAAQERMRMLPMINWAESTTTGDIEEQVQFNSRQIPRIWSQLSAAATAGTTRSPCHHREDCFFFGARTRALNSHIVVINHALFFSELISSNSFLGPLDTVIFDEAHHLEAAGLQALRVELDTARFNTTVEQATEALKKLAANGAPGELIKKGKKALRNIRKQSDTIVSQLHSTLLGQQRGEYTQRLEPQQLEQLPAIASMRIAISQAIDTIEQLEPEPDLLNESNPAAHEHQQLFSNLCQLRADFDYVSRSQTPEHVFWVEGNVQRNWTKLCGVPLQIGAFLQPIWQELSGAAIFTSATIAVEGSTEFFQRQIGLDRFWADRGEQCVFPTEFAPEQSLCATIDCPTTDVQSTRYLEHVASCIEALHQRVTKNTLVLFTSLQSMQYVYQHLRDRGTIEKNNLLCQNLTGNRSLVMKQFLEGRAKVLLGTDSFWEGIDAPGTACEIVVIVKLPFSVPTHPLQQARSEQAQTRYGESFRSLALPEASIKLRQGAGRLIRSITDTGALFILDPRLRTKSYGTLLLRDLPCEFEQLDSIERAIEKLLAFFPPEQGNPS